jgi:hypothetical protein
VDGAILAGRLAGTGDRFGSTYCFFVKFPLVDGFSASFPRQIGVQRSFRFIKGIFRIGSRAAGSVVSFLDFGYEGSNLRTNRRGRGFAWPAAFPRQPSICCPNLFRPARFCSSIQFIECRVGLVGNFSHFALVKKPGEDRPVHGFGHQRLCVLNFGQFSHYRKTLSSRTIKVQCGPWKYRRNSYPPPGILPNFTVASSEVLVQWLN